jgi:putative ABC transport system ATP-binding protein
MSSIISVKNLSKTYKRDKQEITVLNNISLEIERGDFIALMGPSGSGKTTLLNIIAGIDRPTNGNVIVADTNIASLSETQLAKWRSNTIGFIFQFYNLIPVLTAYEKCGITFNAHTINQSRTQTSN